MRVLVEKCMQNVRVCVCVCVCVCARMTHTHAHRELLQSLAKSTYLPVCVGELSSIVYTVESL